MIRSRCIYCGAQTMHVLVSSDAKVSFVCKTCGSDVVGKYKNLISHLSNQKVISYLKPICPLTAHIYAGREKFSKSPLQMLVLEIFHRYYADKLTLTAFRTELAATLGEETRDVVCSWTPDYQELRIRTYATRSEWKHFNSFISGLGMTSNITYQLEKGIETPLHILLAELVRDGPIDYYFRRMWQRKFR